MAHAFSQASLRGCFSAALFILAPWPRQGCLAVCSSGHTWRAALCSRRGKLVDVPYHAESVPVVLPIIALSAGWACGIINIRLLSKAAHELGARSSPRRFAFSSLFRVSIFAIVAWIFAAVGPWWCSLLYIAGFLVTFALFAVSAVRRS